MDKGGAALVLSSLSKLYGEFSSVDSISLEVQPKELITLLGQSGSGKTTTLMMIAGFIEPSTGRIFLDGQDITYNPPHKRGIGMVFQKYSLFPHLTVYENIAFPLKMRRYDLRTIDRKVRDNIRTVKLGGLEERYPLQLSGGQQQRVALARALVFEPRLLLMDEPLGALDKQLREHMQLEIKEIQNQLGITVIYVTHDQGEALTLSDKIAVMNNGKIEQIDAPMNIYENPANAFVADFIGESNFFNGEVVRIEGEITTVYIKEDNFSFKVPSSSRLRIGQKIIVAVRPEKIIIQDNKSLGDYNSSYGIISDLIYVGDSTKYFIALDEPKKKIVVKTQNVDLSKVYKRGERVCITWAVRNTSVVSILRDSEE